MICFRHKKQKEEDIAICECKYNPSDPETACGDGCLNVLTSTECTPGYCPCGDVCKNQVILLAFPLSTTLCIIIFFLSIHDMHVLHRNFKNANMPKPSYSQQMVVDGVF